MCTGYFGRFPCAFGFLVLLQLAYSRPLEGTDKLSDVRNLPEEDKVVHRSTTYHGVNPALSTSEHRNSSANSGRPGCCRPELHLGFDNTTADQHELHGRRAQSPTVTSVEAPCGEYADLNAEHVQFKSAKLPTKTNAITIAVWIKLQSTSGIQPILIVPGEAGELRLELADGHLSWLYTTTRPSLASFAVLSAVPVMPSNLWTHLVVQYDGHTQRSAVFLNGEKLLQGRSIASGGSLEIAWGEFTAIGKYSINEVLELKLNGLIDEFYIYYCAVPEMVIQRLAQTCRVEGKCAPVGPGVDEPCDANGQEWRCDGENDCGDWSDEMGCDGFCGPGEQISTFQGKCVSCFCMGRSLNCSHANMYRNRLKLEVNNFLGGPIMHLVDVNGDKMSGIKYTADQASNELVAHDVSENIQYYWVLPREFLGNQLASYDGKLRYTVAYIPKNPIRHPRAVREIISARNFVADYMIDRNGDEDVNDNDGSGLPMVNISTNEGVFIDSQHETSTTISKTGTDSLETTTSTAYSTERPTLEIATTIQDKTVSVTGASTDGQDETTSFVSSDMSLLVSDDSEDRKITDAPFTDRPTRESSTAVPGTSTKGQDETAVPPSSVYTTLTPTFSTVTDATTDSQYETTTAVSSSNSAERSTTEAPTTTLATTITVTEGVDESTTSVPSIAYSSEKPAMESSTTIQDMSSTVTGASTEGHDETTTSLFSSVYNTDIPTTEILTTIPDASSTLPEVRTYDQDEVTTSVPSAAPSTEIPTTPDMSSSVTDASTASQDETTTDVPSTAYSTNRPTAEASTTILETSSLVSDASTESEDVTTTFVPSSAYNTERLTTEASTTTQDTTYPVTDTLSEGQDETTTVVSSSAYSTERPTTETFTTIPEAPTEAQGETTTALPSLTYSTDRPTMEVVTTIPDVSSTFTEAATEGQDETITFEPSSGYSTQRPTTEASTTIPNTSSTITAAPTAGHDETTTVSIPVTSSIQTDSVSEDPDETTTAVPSSAYRTDTLTTETPTTMPVTHFSKTDTLALDQVEATTVLPSSAYNTQRTTTEASTTILETSSTVTDATTDIPDETSTFVPSSTFSTDRPTKKTDDRPSSVTDALTEGQDETTTSAYSTDRPTMEAAATTPDTSSTVTVTEGQDETTTYAPSTGASTTAPDMSSSVTDASTASQDETTTDVPSTAYSTNRPTAEASTTILETSSLLSDASTEREDETTTFVPSSAHGSERLTTEASTTTQYTTYPVTDTLSEGQDETATVVPSSVYSTDRPTTETSTTIPVTSITETEGDDESTTSVPSLEYSSERPTKELSTTIQDMSSTVTDALTKGQDKTTTSAYSTDRPTMEAAATTPDTSSTVTVTEGQDETTTYAPSTVYNTENHTTEHSTTIPETSTMVTHSLTDDQDETSTVMPSSVYSTDEHSTLTVTTISDTSSTVRYVSTVNTDETTSFTPVASQSTETPTTEASTTKVDISYKETDAWTDSQDITTAYSTERSTMESSTTLPVTSSAITDVFTDVQDATTTSVPSSAHSTKPLNPDTTTTRPETSSIVTDASIDSQDKTTIYVPSSAYSTENVLSETVTTISDTYSTVTDASTKSSDETTTVVFSSAHSTESPTSDKPTTITETSSTVPDASTDGQVGPTTLTTILDMSSTVADELTDGQEETTTSVPSTAYSIEKPTTETVTTIPGSSSTVTVASTEAQDETTTFVPSWSVSTEDRGTETVTTIPDASPTVTDVSTEAQVETTAAGLSSAHSTDKPTTEASTTIPVTSSTVTDVSTSDQGVTTTAVPSAAPTSVAATSTSDPEIRCQFGDGFYPTNTTFVTESCTSRCSCLKDGNLRCFPLCVDDFPYCDDDEEEVESYVPVENSSCHCVERVCVREDITTPTSAFTKITEAASTPSVQITEAVRLVGKDTTLVFHHEVGPSSGNSQTTMEVSLTEAKWRSPDGARTSRDTFMKVLSDVQAIYVRASYSGDGSSIRALSIKDLSLDVASQHDAGFGKALLVEQCDCPAGYSGLSCEYCSPGFTRSGDGLDCMKCSCNNHSDTCDQGNGTCLDCRDNTEGIYCDRCQSGYFGNALKGTPTDCQPCPCPLTMSPNRFSPTCFLDDDGLPTCDSCPEGYAGRNCEQCAIKYKGNPTIRNSKCELTVPKHCDFRGSLDTKPDAITQKCFCKSNVHGITCNACKPGFFNLKADNPQGCTPCFCNGVTNSCRSATVNETQVNITDQSRGTSVEQCACPPEYEGLSCGSCKPGYYKSRVGLYFGKCIKCNCHGHSDDGCDPETGQCKTCEHNTGGFRCEKCLTGFYGNATIGKQTDCKECPCPMTSPPNRFSPTCFMAEDGQPTCDACPPGYGGRRCDKCIKPYVGNPTEPGRKCKREVDCRCDVRGSVNSTCDPETRQCFCKSQTQSRVPM